MKRFIGFCLIAGLVSVSSIVNAQVNLSNGLIAWYPFSGNAGDSSGNGHNGIVQDAKLAKDRFGNANSAYFCDGNSKAITVLALGDYKAQGVSVSLWIKTRKKGAALQLVSGAIGTLYINVHKIGSFVADFDGDMSHLTGANSTDSVVANGTWTNLTATNDGTTTRLYINGLLQKAYPESLSTGGSDLIIGNKGYVSFVDDVRIYSRAISASEVSAIYHLTH